MSDVGDQGEEDQIRKEMINDKENTWKKYNGKNTSKICNRDREVENRDKGGERAMEGRKTKRGRRPGKGEKTIRKKYKNLGAERGKEGKENRKRNITLRGAKWGKGGRRNNEESKIF